MTSISAVTLGVNDMAACVGFYRALGFEVLYGGEGADFTSFGVGDGFLNLQLDPVLPVLEHVWGRFILWVDDVDAVYERAVTGGLAPSFPPTDAPWGERYFHLRDPQGHEVSIARPLDRQGRHRP